MDFVWTIGEAAGDPIFCDMSKVAPEKSPPPVDNFDEIDRRLVNNSGFTNPTLVQKFLIPTILSGRNAVICASIGSGKTTGYILPVFSRMLKDDDVGHGDVDSGFVYPSVLILTSPKKVLDVRSSCLALSKGTLISTAMIAVSQKRDVPDVKNTAVVVADIGKLRSLRDIEEKICLDRLKIIVVDDVDELSSFLFSPAGYFSQIFPDTKVQVVLVTSWLSQSIDLHANRFVGHRFWLYSDHCLGLENVIHNFEKVSENKFKRLVEIVLTENTIVFAESDEKCRSIFDHLSEKGFNPQIVHSGGDVFIGDGHSSLLVATFDACRRMRLPKVDHVIMFDLPSTRLDYCQLISRVQGGRATTLVDSALSSSQKDALDKIREMF